MNSCTRYTFERVREMSDGFKGTFPQAERGMHGTDGRWLWRGAVEEVPHLEDQVRMCRCFIDCDRTACYSGRVWKYLIRFPKITGYKEDGTYLADLQDHSYRYLYGCCASRSVLLRTK